MTRKPYEISGGPFEPYKLEPDFFTKKEVIRAYRYHTLNPFVKVTSNDYRWFDKYIYPIRNEISRLHDYGGIKIAKRCYTPREVQIIFDFLMPPTITK